MNTQEILNNAIAKYGVTAQTVMVMEEMSELQKELCKNLRGRMNSDLISEEIADVEIMLAQMKIIHGCAATVEVIKDRKLRRLAGRIGMQIPEVGT